MWRSCKMTVGELAREQERLNQKIRTQAEKTGLSGDKIQPIYDGIADESGYLNAPLKIAWILKEPYDDYDENGPCGGGWSLPKDCFGKSEAWTNPVWQKVAYVMYGFKNNMTWEEMPSIRNHKDMIKEIRSVAWINISKMPGPKSSSDYKIYKKYDTWKDVLREQLDVYHPDVIVFGKTFHCFRNEYSNAKRKNEYSNEWINYFVFGRQHLISAYHPGRKGGDYVNTLIKALHIAKQELKYDRK